MQNSSNYHSFSLDAHYLSIGFYLLNDPRSSVSVTQPNLHSETWVEWSSTTSPLVSYSMATTASLETDSDSIPSFCSQITSSLSSISTSEPILSFCCSEISSSLEILHALLAPELTANVYWEWLLMTDWPQKMSAMAF